MREHAEAARVNGLIDVEGKGKMISRGAWVMENGSRRAAALVGLCEGQRILLSWPREREQGAKERTVCVQVATCTGNVE